jgi:hypothetical protein
LPRVIFSRNALFISQIELIGAGCGAVSDEIQKLLGATPSEAKAAIAKLNAPLFSVSVAGKGVGFLVSRLIATLAGVPGSVAMPGLRTPQTGQELMDIDNSN